MSRNDLHQWVFISTSLKLQSRPIYFIFIVILLQVF